jgi:hypothetical protein
MGEVALGSVVRRTSYVVRNSVQPDEDHLRTTQDVRRSTLFGMNPPEPNLPSDLQRRLQSKRDRGLRGQFDFFVSGEGCARGSGTSASGGADRGTLASARQTADQSSQACSSAR